MWPQSIPGRALLIAVLAVCVPGCATYRDRVEGFHAAYFAGDPETARERADELLAKPGPESDVIKLDRAIVDLTSGDPRQAEAALREVRDHFDALHKAVATEKALAMATDDSKLPYTGEGYEQILIRAFLSLTALMSGSGDAGAYALQMVETQDRLLREDVEAEQEEAEAPFRRVAFAPWIRAALLEERYTDFDDLRRSRVQVASWEEDFRDAHSDLQRASSGRHSAPGNGVLYVIALVGRGPRKVQVNEQPTSAALLIADRILSATSKHTVPPTVAPVRVANVVQSTGGPDAVEVRTQSGAAGTTATITDVGELAATQYAHVYPRIVARAVVRRILKKGAVYAFKDSTGADDSDLADFAINLAGTAWEAAEKADTRCWSLLPDRIQVLRLELPAGPQDVSLRAVSFGPDRQHVTRGGQANNVRVDVPDGRNAYVLAAFPDHELVGRIQTDANQRSGE